LYFIYFSFTSIQKGGPSSDLSKLVGKDEYGNCYYEDLETNYYINRRWVEFADNRRLASLQHVKIPPPYNGWLCYSYDEFPNKKNFVEPTWRSPKSKQFRSGHPLDSNLYMAPGSLGNPQREDNVEYQKQKTYLPWTPNKEEMLQKQERWDGNTHYDITKH